MASACRTKGQGRQLEAVGARCTMSKYHNPSCNHLGEVKAGTRGASWKFSLIHLLLCPSFASRSPGGTPA